LPLNASFISEHLGRCRVGSGSAATLEHAAHFGVAAKITVHQSALRVSSPCATYRTGSRQVDTTSPAPPALRSRHRLDGMESAEISFSRRYRRIFSSSINLLSTSDSMSPASIKEVLQQFFHS